MTHCPACRQELPDEARFCGFCGFRLAPPLQAVPSARSGAVILEPEPRLGKTEVDPAFADTVMSGSADSLLVPEQDHGPGPRRYRRFPLRVDVSYSSEHNFYTGLSENISSGGLFVATSTPVQIGDPIEVVFTVPGLDRECRARCEVAWVQEASGNPGMGLRFTELDPAVKEAIRIFITHREPILREE